ncbi:gp53-like domain-containing protein [Bordetella genomosp. 6]|uniref:Putative tail fiber protein gp53-like C-terminal domain-containing protein n=1 Tax=Bordetella genomosp. 6 TaxID=463024 RepID=A0ABX4FIF9_9BORD|nr:hypothetical protein [Bordetella genomosp. 6]OZI78745.1 hypothetical protein CAL23_13055 [Bordetella genomosp. 6]
MAINLDERYPGRANGKTLSYPQGSFKNRTSPTAKDGTYLEQDWANDQLAFFQSLIKAAGLTANGTVDIVGASQYFDALESILDAATPDATESIKGLIQIATSAEAQALINNAKVLTPKKLADAFKGSNQSLMPAGYQVYPGGQIKQWQFVDVANGATITYPIPFPNACVGVQITRSGSTGASPGSASSIPTRFSFTLGHDGGSATRAYYIETIGY